MRRHYETNIKDGKTIIFSSDDIRDNSNYISFEAVKKLELDNLEPKSAHKENGSVKGSREFESSGPKVISNLFFKEK